ncbi:MAG TPA: GntR family transcriptional regulator [Rhizomicrobium sp.]|nr:GntR family transcriptional regulator [Rhizomicrobium sp.]
MPAKRAAPSRLQADLAQRILRLLKEQSAAPGHHLVELDLCAAFGVSRTPVRGALRLLAAQGWLTARDGRGFVLAKKLPEMPDTAGAADEDSEDQRLFHALAAAREQGRLPDRFTQQELVRRTGAGSATVLRVLRQLSELGLLERRPGNGWAFGPTADTARTLAESYTFRRALEPAMLLQPAFRLDRAWVERSRAAHRKLRNKNWQAGDSARFDELNADFHQQLANCSGNRYMRMAVERQIQLRRFLSHQWDYPREQVHAAIDDHLEILAALESGYADKAAALMLHHLTQSASQSQKEDPQPA